MNYDHNIGMQIIISNTYGTNIEVSHIIWLLKSAPGISALIYHSGIYRNIFILVYIIWLLYLYPNILAWSTMVIPMKETSVLQPQVAECLNKPVKKSCNQWTIPLFCWLIHNSIPFFLCFQCFINFNRTTLRELWDRTVELASSPVLAPRQWNSRCDS